MRIISKQTIQRIAYGLSGVFLLIHIGMLLLFLRYDVFPMVVVNCFSIVFYLLSVLLIRWDAFRLYMVSVCIEVMIHMGLAVYYTGWDSGFQITLLGLYIIAFYAEYVARTMGWPYPHALIMSFAAMAEYIILYVICTVHPAAYPLPDGVSFFLQILWAVTVFLIGSACLYYFVRVATRSELVLANEAETDKLTGLYNRAGYDKVFSELDIHSTVLLLIDGDRFKAINDNYGHETGDLILKKIANLLTRMFRSDDYICRIGGDEFVVLMKENKELTKATIRQKIEAINQELSSPEDNLPPMSISVGVAGGRNCKHKRELFTSADRALYSVKDAGGKGCAFSGEWT